MTASKLPLTLPSRVAPLRPPQELDGVPDEVRSGYPQIEEDGVKKYKVRAHSNPRTL